VQPPGDPLGQCRDDDLVVLAALERLAHRLERVGGADDPFDMGARSFVEQRNRELERDGGLLGVRIPIRSRHQEGELAGPACNPLGDGGEQLGRCCGAMGHDEDMPVTHGGDLPLMGEDRPDHPLSLQEQNPRESGRSTRC
jgi:hypothetical protein